MVPVSTTSMSRNSRTEVDLGQGLHPSVVSVHISEPVFLKCVYALLVMVYKGCLLASELACCKCDASASFLSTNRPS